ncbi:helix-turn-helix domain-containing protein [Streptomyces sp. NPDC056670]|uniref:helix-turn-helix domain-containing protein n=1 Tax=Streptomyces sp. NPDC056670 TaxID=3345904 RepID=UPI0036BE92E8
MLEHAQRQFAQHGYAATTVEGVADTAGMSPNLVTRYFGGKDGLFLVATRVEIPVSHSFDGDPLHAGCAPGGEHRRALVPGPPA